MADDMVIETCFKCGVRFGMPRALYNTARREGPKHSFYCPNGHGQCYTESSDAKLKRELDQLRQREAFYEDQLREERELRETADRRATAYKGHLTRTKKRISAGTCPCCKRHFTNLERHMHTKHPEFADPEPDDTVVELKSA